MRGVMIGRVSGDPLNDLVTFWLSIYTSASKILDEELFDLILNVPVNIFSVMLGRFAKRRNKLENSEI